MQPQSTTPGRTCRLCSKPLRARGLCSAHYQRWQLYGNALVGYSPLCGTLAERLWRRVDKNGPLSAHRPDLGPCWIWTGGKTGRGYGGVANEGTRREGTRRLVNVHRLAYELLVGPIPSGLTLDHLCRVRLCVRPAHLEPVTLRMNILRGEGPTAKQARQTHCKRGHPFDKANTSLQRGKRSCRACKSLSRRHLL